MIISELVQTRNLQKVELAHYFLYKINYNYFFSRFTYLGFLFVVFLKQHYFYC